MKNIVLIGFMGTGKTAAGKNLAARLKREFVDTDTAIEELTGKTITEIFRKDGQIRFRSEEKLQIKKLARREDLVISTGGGLVLDNENVEMLQENGVLICLTAAPDVICKRVRRKGNRPLLQKGDARETINRLLDERSGAYSVAEFTLDTSTGTLNDTVDKIISYLKEKKYI